MDLGREHGFAFHSRVAPRARAASTRRTLRRDLLAVGLVGALAWPAASHAAPAVYTNSIPFFASLPGPARTASFDSLASGQVIASGSAANGITFGHALGGVDLIVTAGSLDTSGASFPTTSAPHFLGTSDLDVFLDGDELPLGFAAANAVGLFVVTRETPGVTLFDGDIRLAAGGGSAALDVDAVEATLTDGSRVYFLGVIDASSNFTSAQLGTFGQGGEFAFNVDDIVTALPEPNVAGAMGAALLAVAVVESKRRPK